MKFDVETCVVNIRKYLEPSVVVIEQIKGRVVGDEVEFLEGSQTV